MITLITIFLLLTGFYTNLDDFIAKLPLEGSFKPMGELLHSYKHNEKDYEIYFVSAKCYP
jgi:hypothetical protein